MSRTPLTGSFVALITPFNKDGSVDLAAFRTLLKFQEEQGTSAVLIMGSTGEASMLSPEEKKKIIVETAKMKSPRMPLFYGCTGNNTETTIETVKFAKASGADGAILDERNGGFQLLARLFGLHPAEIVERHVALPLQPALGVPVGLAMADEIDGAARAPARIGLRPRLRLRRRSASPLRRISQRTSTLTLRRHRSPFCQMISMSK